MVGNYNMDQVALEVTMDQWCWEDMARTIAGNTYFVFKLRIIFSIIYKMVRTATGNNCVILF